MKYKFQDDIKDGLAFELKVMKMLETELDHCIIVGCSTKDYDLEILDEQMQPVAAIEVKNDLMSATTGNVAIEWQCRGLPSGINVTKAGWWVQGINDEPFFITVTKLKEMIKEKGVSSVSGGDKGSDTRMYLIKVDKFKSECTDKGKMIDDFRTILEANRLDGKRPKSSTSSKGVN